MTWKGWSGGMVAVAALVVLAAAGCTGSEVIAPDRGQFTIRVAANPVYTGRYEVATVGVSQIAFRPMDPQADHALGLEPMGMLSDALVVNVAQSGELAAAPQSLNSGSYRITKIVLQNIKLTDQNPPADPATCLENFGVLPTLEIQSRVPSQFVIGDGVHDLTPPVVFTVARGGQGSLHMSIDGAALVSVVEGAFAAGCHDSSPCGSFAPPLPSPCLDSYVPITDTQLRALISFQ